MSLDQTALATAISTTGPDRFESRILEQRARWFAAPAAAAVEDTTFSIIVFGIGRESYGLDLIFVSQVVKVGALVQVPGARPPFAGLLNIRGEIVSAFSVGQAIGIVQKPVSEQSRILVCGDLKSRFALLADDVMHAITVRASELAPPTQSAALANCTRGITASGVVVLEGAALAGPAGPLFRGTEGGPQHT